jgi:NADH-quinone oxidoreductase subunit N
VKRMLAYSSVSHAGFLLIAIVANSEEGATALLYYLVPYAAATVGLFAVVASRERELQRPVSLAALEGLGWERPFLGVSMWAFVLSMAGFPLTGGFVGKLFVFSAAYEAGWWWLVVIGVVATALSLAYYLAIVRALYMRQSQVTGTVVAAGGSPPRDWLLNTGVTLALVVTIGSFFAVQPIVDLASDAAASLPF